MPLIHPDSICLCTKDPGVQKERGFGQIPAGFLAPRLGPCGKDNIRGKELTVHLKHNGDLDKSLFTCVKKLLVKQKWWKTNMNQQVSFFRDCGLSCTMSSCYSLEGNVTLGHTEPFSHPDTTKSYEGEMPAMVRGSLTEVTGPMQANFPGSRETSRLGLSYLQYLGQALPD